MAQSQKNAEDLTGGQIHNHIQSGLNSGRPKLRSYDFRRPDKFSKDHLRGAELLFDHYTRQLTSHLSAQFRMAVHADVASIEQTTYEEYMEHISNPCCVVIVNWGELPSNMLIDLSLKLVLPMLDRLCGGSGNVPSISRILTEIEMGMTRQLSEELVSVLETSVKESKLEQGDLAVSSLEVNPLFVQQVMPPGEMVLSVTIRVKFGSHSGNLEFCLPFTLMEPILPRLSANKWYSRNQFSDKEYNGQTAVPIENIEVPLTCRLGSTVLSLGEVGSITEGDVLELDTRKDGLGTLHVLGKPKFQVEIGMLGNRLAARIVSVIDEGLGEEDLV